MTEIELEEKKNRIEAPLFDRLREIGRIHPSRRSEEIWDEIFELKTRLDILDDENWDDSEDNDYDDDYDDDYSDEQGRDMDDWNRGIDDDEYMRKFQD